MKASKAFENCGDLHYKSKQKHKAKLKAKKKEEPVIFGLTTGDAAIARARLCEAQNHRCIYCHTNKRVMTIEHIVTKSQGGRDVWSNLVAACTRCNWLRSDKVSAKVFYELLHCDDKKYHTIAASLKKGNIKLAGFLGTIKQIRLHEKHHINVRSYQAL